MRTYFLLGFIFCLLTASGQTPFTKANYQLASRFSPKKLDRMIFSLSVDPHFLKNSDRFWYTYETSNGKSWYIVDPSKGTRRPLFDNDRMASLLTAAVKDPMEWTAIPSRWEM